jgi:5-methylcytosine-specific restriction endonuclease McrA
MIITKSSSWITPERRLAIYLRDHFQCVACGIDLEDMDPNMVTLDHIISKQTFKQWTNEQRVDFGSINKTSNLVTCCKPCNSSKKQSDNYKTFGAMERVMNSIKKPINIALAKQLIYG